MYKNTLQVPPIMSWTFARMDTSMPDHVPPTALHFSTSDSQDTRPVSNEIPQDMVSYWCYRSCIVIAVPTPLKLRCHPFVSQKELTQNSLLDSCQKCMHGKLIFMSYIVKKIPGSTAKFGRMALNITID